MKEMMEGRRRKAPKPPLVVETRLLDWGPRGGTEADLDGRRISVDRGIPGERVVASIQRGRSRRLGMVDQVLDVSPDRVDAPCPYYHVGCGGCQWQHVAYAAQLRAKRQRADAEMAAAGLQARITSVHPMADPWRYRRTAAIAIGWEAGFRPRGRRGIIEIHDCLISHPLLGHLAGQLNLSLRAGELPNYHGKVWLECTVVGSEKQPALQVMLQGIRGLTLDDNPELTDVARTIASMDGVESVAYRHRSGEPRPLVGDLMSLIEVAGCSMYLPAGSFFQTNSLMVQRVLTRLREEISKQTIAHAADIYGGVGTFGLLLASYVESMVIVELDPMAVEAARRTAALWELTNVTFLSRHAERALPVLSSLDLAIVDPPRSGLGEVVVEALVASGPPLLFYVSCAPPSLARDLATLEAGGYHVRSVELFDFYPQTHHTECLAVLQR